MHVNMPSVGSRRTIATVTTVGLGSISALHVLWGRGSTFPFRDVHDLNDHVIGQQVSPSPTACNTVAGLLAVAAVSIDRTARGSRVARPLAIGCGVVLAVRSGLGFSGRTHVAVPGSTSPAFRRNDRRMFAPLCAVLALGALRTAVGPSGRAFRRPGP